MKELAVSQHRIVSIDVLRGIIVVIMGLDHIRDFIAITPFDLLDVTQTTPLWFFTRWITHFCAPVFVFLAGMSAYLYGQKVNKKDLSRFLWTRGLWLIVIEFTLVRFGWTFDFNFFFVQVIWVIGWSMILLSALIFLPRWFLISFTILLIAGHNFLDKIEINEYWWHFLHQQRWEGPVAVVYPLIPWPAVMTFGYLLGEVYTLTHVTRKRIFLVTGTLLIMLFVVLRYTNVYGDPQPWATQPRGALYTFLDFLDTTKYPPSLLFLCMTLGPAIVLLPFLRNIGSRVTEFFMAFGRVPFFFYIVHLYVGHSLAIIYNGFRYNEWRMWLFGAPPADFQPSIIVAYTGWIVLTIIMYFLCRWFGEIKKQYPYWWLKYL